MSQTIEATKTQPTVGLPKLENILLCTDFSPAAKDAARATVELCKGRDARVTVAHVSEYGPMPAITEEGLDYVLGLYKKEQSNLKSVTEELLQNGVRAEALMLEGSAASCILDYIKHSSIDLAIVGTTAVRGVDRLLLGSTAESIFRRAICPVLTVGPGLQPTSLNLGRPVVFATDFNDRSLDALLYAASLAETIGSPLHVVNVLPLTVRDDTEVAPRIVGKALHLVTMRVPADGSVPHCEVLRGSDVAHSVVEYARAQEAAYIVLGVRRKSAVAAHLPPHRTFRIIMTAPCPVLTVGYDLKTPSAESSHSC